MLIILMYLSCITLHIEEKKKKLIKTYKASISATLMYKTQFLLYNI
jgi:hypothetical protein